MSDGQCADGMFRCPNGHIGRIDEEQLNGEVSIICDSCDFHGYVSDGELLDSGGGESA